MLLAFAITNCSKDGNIEGHNMLKDAFVNPYNYVGEWHNNGCQYILENIEYIPTGTENIYTYIEDIYEEWEYAILPFVQPEFPEDIEDLDLYEWVDNLSGSVGFKVLLTNTLELLESMPGLEVITDSVVIWEEKASNSLSGSELDTYYEHLALAKYSAYFWSPECEGGLEGIKYLGLKKKSTMAINWWKVFGADCIGGIAGGAVGYLAVSSVAVIMQL